MLHQVMSMSGVTSKLFYESSSATGLNTVPVNSTTTNSSPALTPIHHVVDECKLEPSVASVQGNSVLNQLDFNQQNLKRKQASKSDRESEDDDEDDDDDGDDVTNEPELSRVEATSIKRDVDKTVMYPSSSSLISQSTVAYNSQFYSDPNKPPIYTPYYHHIANDPTSISNSLPSYPWMKENGLASSLPPPMPSQLQQTKPMYYASASTGTTTSPSSTSSPSSSSSLAPPPLDPIKTSKFDFYRFSTHFRQY